MMYDDAGPDLKRQGQMEIDRANFESLWQDVAEHLLPRQADMLTQAGMGTAPVQGMKRTGKIFDETAMLALDRGVAACEGYSIPKGTRWQNLAPLDDALLKPQHVREWYERKTSQLFALRTAPQSGFDTQTHESFASLLAFGGQAMWPELLRDRRGKPLGIFYRSEHIGTLWVQENAFGRIDTVHRKFSLTARQALQQWPDNPPECAAKAMADDRPEARHAYLHVIAPNRDHDPGKMDHRGKPIASRYIAIEDRAVFARGGFRSMPIAYSRYEKSPTETYGRGPGITVLPAVKACQRMMRDLVTAAEFMARPALLAPDDSLDMMIQYFAGGVTYGGIDGVTGQKLLQPMFEGIDMSAAKQLLDETRAIIQQAFFNDLFLVQQGELKSHVSAQAILERTQEKGVLLAPIGRQETEWFGPMADREIDLMGEMGLLEDMPPEVIEAGGAYQVRYENPLARAQKADQAGGYFQLLQGITPIMQAKPQLIDEFLNRYPFDKVVEGLAWIFGVPASWEADEQARAAGQQQMASAAQAQQLLAAAPVVADVADKLSGAAAGGGGNALAA